MRNSSEPNDWDIWLAKIDFEEMEGSKIRPILIIDNNAFMVQSLKMTSHSPRENVPGEYPIKLWKESGLNKPTTIRISKRLTLPNDLLVKRIGTLQVADRENVKTIYRSMYHSDLA